MNNYSVTPITEIKDTYLEPVDTAISNRIRRLREYLKTVLQHGFQSCIEIENLDTHDIVYKKGILIGTSGSFAQVKMDTLKKFSEIPMTGICSISELIKMIHDVRPGYDVSTFSNLENVCQLTRLQQEELRRELGITAYLGGIRFPFTRYISTTDIGEDQESYEGRITFSALTGEGDLAMCCVIMQEMQEALQKSESQVCYSFDLSQLEQQPVANFTMKMYGIESVLNK